MKLGLQLLVVALASLCLCYGAGSGLLRWLRPVAEEFFWNCFLRLLSGAVLLTASYAIWQTRGATTLLPVLLLVLGMLCALRAPGGTAPGPAFSTGRQLAWVLAMAGVVFAGQFLLVYEPGSPFLQTPFQDYVYYSRLTLPLNHLGIETNSLEMLYPQFQTAQPYHYFGIWLNALTVRLTGLLSVWVYFVSVATVMLTTCGVGFAAIYTHCGLRPGWAVVLGLATLTVTGTCWPYLLQYKVIADGSLVAHLPLVLHPKLGSIYLFEILAVLLLLRRRYRAAGLALAAVPLAFISTAPAIGIGVAALAAYLWAVRKASIVDALSMVAPTAGVGIYLGVFYLVSSSTVQLPGPGQKEALATIIPPIGEARLVFNIAVGALLIYGLYYFGYAVLVAGLGWRKVTRATLLADLPLIVWAAATVLGAAIMRAIGHHFLDAFQFFSNPILPLSAAVIAVGVGRGVQGSLVVRPLLALAGIAALALVNTRTDTTGNGRFSSQFLHQVGPVLQKLPNRGGYLLADADYENPYMLWADSYTAGTYVSNFKNDYLLLSLSALVPDSLATDSRFARAATEAAQAQRNTTIYHLAQLQHLAGHPIPATNLPIALVRRARLAFICTSRKAMLPASLRALVRASYHDALSGESLYVLKSSVFLGQESTIEKGE
ncbi:hypothetical protein MUN81_17850 [Hymenobacter sp. 5317J-9]|uniref:hypothetical protein n=1 Tax=Hymenobacter sp. 5317J-9 TaxID=2932250 RepID=UPI001FD6F95D|nr:hypothetical protein [Hymenobacter sp. 5317J-9]UOQ97092.1 hypothetical protein MUN81_17850 [Hymenobacter sp. 5317J-9]